MPKSDFEAVKKILNELDTKLDKLNDKTFQNNPKWDILISLSRPYTTLGRQNTDDGQTNS
jgi:hypothetical protein